MAEKKKLIPKFPSWFNPWNRPHLTYKPEEYLTSREYIGSRVQVYDNAELPIEEGFSYCLDIESCYDGDPPEVYLCKFITKKIKNPNYKGQLKSYEDQENNLKEWDRLNALWPEYQKQEEGRKKLALYKKLKKEFEG